MKKNYEEKIKLFTALAGSVSLLSPNSVNSQSTIIVRDISPDVIVNSATPTYSLDVDNNGTVDFTIERRSYGGGGSHFYFKGTGSIGYGIPTAGMSNAHTFKKPSSSTDWYVARLNVGDTTKYTTEYNDNRYTRLFAIDGSGVLTDVYQWVSGTTDKYVGVQFTIGTNVHFGWVKLDVASDYSSVTVKEVGYENEPDALMKAGAIVSANKATSVLLGQTGSLGNPSDLRVSFTKAASETNILKYRAFLVPTASVSSLTLALAQEAPITRYMDIPKTGSNITTNLPSTLLDAFGAAYSSSTAYSVVIESVGDNSTGDALSAPSISGFVGLNNSSALPNVVIYSEASSLFVKNSITQGNISIKNLLGAEVYSGSINQGDNTISLSELSNGVYIVDLNYNGLTTSKKVSIQK